ncbi:regulatory protein, FmdB family [Alkalidesulfovibrio alkalitolerans DSM 16529]|uniref:Regulatory protein, FmdB family n=1 Tax=Alkalidesulfovibrio alkalitolerans DSM 16529 TaxID=1121439 RepID=S7UTM3_9BACT|nr:zinc ribbon domain-containing protein [Alkalidesulfovibrio alkalitolerans]EPR35678.1 regulatory protein, FmdB family [Alkalidesulfovibrio alkalitolerans DSM 16529]
MPIYEFVCEKCGREFEELVFGDARPPCPACAASDTKKLMSRCRHKSGGAGGDFAPSMPSSGGSGCAGCSGGSCATCK